MFYLDHNKKIEARGPREPDMKPNVRINSVKGYRCKFRFALRAIT